MGSRMKEDEKIEREIRSLSKLPENRRCINCNSLGPQYVCTTFWTFVCTNCSGIQREFNHRVKSVSMAKFTAEEVTALQACGNEKAKKIYFKDWDPHRQSYPDTNNFPRLRDFIKQVYVDRRFTGERAQNNLPKLRLNDKEESYESRKLSFSRSERYEDRNDMRSPSSRNEDMNVKYYYDDRRSPRYASRNGSHRRNPVKIEVVDYRVRDDKSRTRRFSSIESKETAVSSDVQKNVDRGMKGAPDSEEGSVKGNPAEPKTPETQISTVDTSQVSDTATAPETESTSQSNDGSDWAPFEISPTKEASQIPNTNTSKCSTTETTTKPLDAIEFLLAELSGPLYATASSMSDVNTAVNDTSKARVEDISIDADLAPPTSADHITSFPNKFGASSVTSTSNSDLTQPSTACSSATQTMSPSVRDVPSLNQPEVAPKAQNLSKSHIEPSLQAAPEAAQDTRFDVRSQPRITQTKSIGRSELPAPELAPKTQDLSNSLMEPSLQPAPEAAQGTIFDVRSQPRITQTKSIGRNELPALQVVNKAQDLSNSLMELSLQAAPGPAQDTRSNVRSQPRITQTKSIGRKELPADLFTTSYLPAPAPQAGWQNFQPHYMGYGLQYYPNAAPISAFPTAAKSTNPFDVNEGRPQAHASPFPTMANLHGPQNAMSTGAVLARASSLGALGSMVTQSPNYASSVPPQSPFTPAFPSGAYFEQVNNNMQPPRPRRAGSLNGETTFQLDSAGGYMAPGYTLNSFPKTGGNPFG